MACEAPALFADGAGALDGDANEALSLLAVMGQLHCFLSLIGASTYLWHAGRATARLWCNVCSHGSARDRTRAMQHEASLRQLPDRTGNQTAPHRCSGGASRTTYLSTTMACAHKPWSS